MDETEPHDHPARVVAPGPLRYPPPMDWYDGLPITRICHNAIVNQAGYNHCAHFVCHVMRWNQITGALRCNFLSHHDTPGVHVRVNEIFNVAPNRALWGAGAALPDSCLIYATVPSNIHGTPPIMGQNEHKHIGIHHMNKIWHYSTAHTRVFGDTPQRFRQKFGGPTGAYGPNTVFYRSDFIR
jgi:hypothetical protein